MAAGEPPDGPGPRQRWGWWIAAGLTALLLWQPGDLSAAAADLASGRGVGEALHARLPDWLGDDDSIDWSRASVDSVVVRAKRGAC